MAPILRRKAKKKCLTTVGIIITGMVMFYFRNLLCVCPLSNNTYIEEPNGVCKGCYKWRVPSVILPRPNLCISAQQAKLDLALLVTSIHKNRLHRDVIRDTWGSYAQTTHSRIRVVFAFGLDPKGNQTEEAKLRQEASDLGDILQFNLNGTYRSLAEIVLNSFAWVLANCTRAKFIGKLSDDAYANIPELLRLLDTRGEDQLQDVIFGDCFNATQPVRTPGHKWYTSKKDYPFEFYPRYCPGAGYFLSRDVLGEVTKVASNIAFPAGLDDAMLGMAVRISGHCTCTIPGFSFSPYPTVKLQRLVRHRHIECKHYRAFQYRLAFHFHGAKPDQIAQMWRYRACSKGRHRNFSTLKCPRKGTCKENVYILKD